MIQIITRRATCDLCLVQLAPGHQWCSRNWRPSQGTRASLTRNAAVPHKKHRHPLSLTRKAGVPHKKRRRPSQERRASLTRKAGVPHQERGRLSEMRALSTLPLYTFRFRPFRPCRQGAHHYGACVSHPVR